MSTTSDGPACHMRSMPPRTNFYNAQKGKDHSPIGTFVVMEENQSWTNRAVGETDVSLEGLLTGRTSSSGRRCAVGWNEEPQCDRVGSQAGPMSSYSVVLTYWFINQKTRYYLHAGFGNGYADLTFEPWALAVGTRRREGGRDVA